MICKQGGRKLSAGCTCMSEAALAKGLVGFVFREQTAMALTSIISYDIEALRQQWRSTDGEGWPISPLGDCTMNMADPRRIQIQVARWKCDPPPCAFELWLTYSMLQITSVNACADE